MQCIINMYCIIFLYNSVSQFKSGYVRRTVGSGYIEFCRVGGIVVMSMYNVTAKVSDSWRARRSSTRYPRASARSTNCASGARWPTPTPTGRAACGSSRAARCTSPTSAAWACQAPIASPARPAGRRPRRRRRCGTQPSSRSR